MPITRDTRECSCCVCVCVCLVCVCVCVCACVCVCVCVCVCACACVVLCTLLAYTHKQVIHTWVPSSAKEERHNVLHYIIQ